MAKQVTTTTQQQVAPTNNYSAPAHVHPMMYQADINFKQTSAYMDAHCAGFLGNYDYLPRARNGFEQQCIDRGLQDGIKARTKALQDQPEQR